MSRLTVIPATRYQRLVALSLAVALAARPSIAAQGADAPAAAIDGPRVTSQSFADWTYRCQQPMTDGKPGAAVCALAENVIVDQSGKSVPVMTITVTPSTKGKGYGLAFRVPLGVRLRQGVGVSADAGMPQLFSFDFCGPQACWADGALGEALLRDLKRGKTGRAKLVLFNGQGLVIEFPLAGLDEGLAALDGGAKGTP
jgi:invasion protein IalB